MPEQSQGDEADRIYSVFKKNLLETKSEEDPNGHIGWALYRSFKGTLITSGVIRLVWCLVRAARSAHPE